MGLGMIYNEVFRALAKELPAGGGLISDVAEPFGDECKPRFCSLGLMKKQHEPSR